MPRVNTKENIEKPKRVPRRQVVKRSVSTRVRKSPTVAVEEKRITDDVEERVIRRAPTNIDTTKTRVRFSRKVIIFTGSFVAVFALAVWIGTTDNGQINVASKIEERNKQIANGEFTEDNSSGANGGQIIPVQNTTIPNVPNGGLKGRGVGSASTNNQQAAVASVENSTSTEDVGTTTASTTDEESDKVEVNKEVESQVGDTTTNPSDEVAN